MGSLGRLAGPWGRFVVQGRSRHGWRYPRPCAGCTRRGGSRTAHDSCLGLLLGHSGKLPKSVRDGLHRGFNVSVQRLLIEAHPI